MTGDGINDAPHAIRVRGTHIHYRDFLDYGDARAYREELDTRSGPGGAVRAGRD
jgi:hypothetical protein